LSLSQKEFSDHEIDHAWNIMLGDLPQRRVAMLEEVGATKRIYLLSNTNGIHYRAFCADIEKNMKIQRFEALFQKLYWSHELGMRKPNQDIFQHVLSDNGLDPASTLFIDDSPQHVEGARKLGIKAFHLTGEICDQVEMWISQSKLKQ
jgi:putative hydrolase of the HAD superfamily